VAGIPIARWADRGNRNHVVTLTTGLWSAMVAISGLVGNFTQLLLVRVGVAVGESGCVPPAQSLISDYFDRAERPRAMAIYWMSGPLSTILAYLGGGWLIEQFGWRITFMVIGIPGVLLAILVKFTLREPRLNRTANTDTTLTTNHKTEIKQASLKVVVKTLWQKPAFRHVVMAFCVAIFFGAGIGIWIPAFFMRSHGMDISSLGLLFGLAYGVGSIVGMLLGGWTANRLIADSAQKPLWFAMSAAALSIPITAAIFIVPSLNMALAMVFLSVLIWSMANAPMIATIQMVVHARVRSTAVAFTIFITSIFGFALGPMLVGVISDLFTELYGDESLRYALLVSVSIVIGVVFCLYRSGKNVISDLEQLQNSGARQSPHSATPSINTGGQTHGE